MNPDLLKRYFFFIILFNLNSSAQKFPDEMNLSSDERRLVIGNNLPYKGFYKSNTIRNINLQFSSANYWTTLTNNFPNRIDMMCKMTIDGVVYDSVGVRFKGNSSYTAIGNSPKKSFNISLDDFIPGQNIGGYNTIVLNNCFADPSFLNEIIYEEQISKHIASPKGNFAHLSINGQDWGIYDNVEQLNHDYEKEWFLSHTGALWRARNPLNNSAPRGSNGDSLASLYNFGTDTNFYSWHYNLKSSNIPDPFTKLMTAIQVLDTVSANNVENILGNYLDIDAALWLIVSENIFGDDDSYLYKARKDYYIYYEPESGRIIPLEMDGNDTYQNSESNLSVFFNVNDPNFVLMHKLLNIPSMRQRYLAHMRTAVKDELDTIEDFSIIDSYYSLIGTFVQADPKKLYTYADFVNKKPLQKQFIKDRRANILSNSEVAQVGPKITNTVFYSDSIAWKRPMSNENVWVNTSVTSTNGINRISLYSAFNLAGKFLKDTMFDDGLHHDHAAGDGIYGAMISKKPGATWVRFYIEATANNAAKTVSYDPEGAEHDVYTYLVLPSFASDTSVVINELMAKNISTITDSAGDYEDWIELFNNSSQPKDISGFYLTDKKYNLKKWKLPEGTIIPPFGYRIVWADESKFEGKFNTNYNLSSTHGENLLLLNSRLELVDEVTFGPQPADKGYARVPNGAGPFIIQSPTFNGYNNSVPHASIVVNDTICSLIVRFSNNSTNASSYSWNFGDGPAFFYIDNPVYTYSNPGNYTITLLANNGINTDTDYATITVYADSSVNFGTDTIVSNDIAYQLDAGTGFSNYHWSTSETTQIITVNNEGTYCVEVLTAHGCYIETCVYVILNPNGIENPDESGRILFPNPADDHLTLISADSKKLSLEVFNVLGEIVYSNDFQKSILINTQIWVEGIYLIRFGSISKIFVVKH